MTVSSALRKAWWVLVLGAVLGAVVGLVVDLRLAGADYTSSSQVLISGGGSSNSSDSAYNTNQYINQRMSTYAQLASSDQVVVPASRQLGIDSADLAQRVTGSIDGDTTVITLNVRGSSPADAVRAGRAETQAFTQAMPGSAGWAASISRSSQASQRVANSGGSRRRTKSPCIGSLPVSPVARAVMPVAGPGSGTRSARASRRDGWRCPPANRRWHCARPAPG